MQVKMGAKKNKTATFEVLCMDSKVRLEILRTRVDLLLKMKHDFLEQISKELPDSFGKEPIESADLFKWFEGKQITDSAKEAHAKVEILEGIMDEMLEEIRALSGNDPKHLFDKHKR